MENLRNFTVTDNMGNEVYKSMEIVTKNYIVVDDMGNELQIKDICFVQVKKGFVHFYNDNNELVHAVNSEKIVQFYQTN